MQHMRNAQGGTIKAALSFMYRGIDRVIPGLVVVTTHLIVVGLAGFPAEEPTCPSSFGGCGRDAACYFENFTLNPNSVERLPLLHPSNCRSRLCRITPFIMLDIFGPHELSEAYMPHARSYIEPRTRLLP